MKKVALILAWLALGIAIGLLFNNLLYILVSAIGCTAFIGVILALVEGKSHGVSEKAEKHRMLFEEAGAKKAAPDKTR